MDSIVSRLDEVLKSLEAQGLTPVTIVLSEEDHAALAQITDWPVTGTARGELRFRSTPVFKARESEGASIVGRGVNGTTKRMTFGPKQNA
ncbi:MAG TPA: hypothetical protein VL460_06345 [Caulobacteraceae bacterium]|jgi:hypothetical protein|nr:hypothetical protein [Caulobacteraceae bacterium]